MKFKKQIVIYFFLLLLLFLSFKFKIQIKINKDRKDKVVVGLDINFPPMGFLDKDNKIIGFDIDLAKEVFKNKTVVFQPINWDAKELELNSGRIDVIWNGMSKTYEREQSMLLTKPYMKNLQIIIVDKNSKIEKLKDLENKIVCMQKGSTGADAFDNHYISKNVKEKIEVEDMITCLNEIMVNKSEAAVVDEIVAKYYLNEKGLKENFKILDEGLSEEEYVIAVKKGNTKLKNEIQDRLIEMKESGITSEISKKWFGADLLFWEESEKNSIKNDDKKIGYKLILEGTITTLKLFIFTLVFSIPIGLILCLLQNSKIKILNFIVKIYTSIIRGTPLLLQLFFIFYGIVYIPVIGEYLTIKDRFLAGVITFVLNYAAYFVEIFRSGFLGIDKGQNEAAQALGFSKVQLLFKILMPQVLRIILPTICNECITLVKDTALIFAIGVPELLSNTKNLVNSTTNVMGYVVAGMIYLVICSILVGVFKKLENKFSISQIKSI